MSAAVRSPRTRAGPDDALPDVGVATVRDNLLQRARLRLVVAFVVLAFKAWETGIYGPAVFLLILGGFVAPIFIRYVVRHVAAWVRGARGAWWLRLSTTGFEVNERLFGPPRRYKWCEIDSFILTGEREAEERVGFRYSRECHRFRHRRGAKPDGFVMGHWDRDPDEAVDLMTEWLTRYKAA